MSKAARQPSMVQSLVLDGGFMATGLGHFGGARDSLRQCDQR